MKVTCEITDYSDPAQPSLRVHNAWGNGDRVELEIEDKRYTVDGKELISAVQRCLLDCFGK